MKIILRMGSRKAAVLPEPVCAQAMRSRFPMMMGRAYFCTGVGLEYSANCKRIEGRRGRGRGEGEEGGRERKGEGEEGGRGGGGRGGRERKGDVEEGRGRGGRVE